MGKYVNLILNKKQALPVSFKVLTMTHTIRICTRSQTCIYRMEYYMLLFIYNVYNAYLHNMLHCGCFLFDFFMEGNAPSKWFHGHCELLYGMEKENYKEKNCKEKKIILIVTQTHKKDAWGKNFYRNTIHINILRGDCIIHWWISHLSVCSELLKSSLWAYNKFLICMTTL